MTEIKNKETPSNDLHEQNRETLFANEAFLIGMLQVVSLAVLGFFFSQNEESYYADPSTIQVGIKIFLTLITSSLIFSILAALFKHQYKQWDVKIPCAKNEKDTCVRKCKANFYLSGMRCFMIISACLIITAFFLIIIRLWT